jgi:hypothetical protein
MFVAFLVFAFLGLALLSGGWFMFATILFSSTQMASDPSHLALFAGVTAGLAFLWAMPFWAWRLHRTGREPLARLIVAPTALIGFLLGLWFFIAPAFLDRVVEWLLPA